MPTRRDVGRVAQEIRPELEQVHVLVLALQHDIEHEAFAVAHQAGELEEAGKVGVPRSDRRERDVLQPLLTM